MNKRIKKKIKKRCGFHNYKAFREYNSWRDLASSYINRNKRRYSLDVLESINNDFWKRAHDKYVLFYGKPEHFGGHNNI